MMSVLDKSFMLLKTKKWSELQNLLENLYSKSQKFKQKYSNVPFFESYFQDNLYQIAVQAKKRKHQHIYQGLIKLGAQKHDYLFSYTLPKKLIKKAKKPVDQKLLKAAEDGDTKTMQWALDNNARFVIGAMRVSLAHQNYQCVDLLINNYVTITEDFWFHLIKNADLKTFKKYYFWLNSGSLSGLEASLYHQKKEIFSFILENCGADSMFFPAIELSCRLGHWDCTEQMAQIYQNNQKFF